MAALFRRSGGGGPAARVPGRLDELPQDLLRCGLSAMVRRKHPRHHDRELRSAADPAANPADLGGFPYLYGLHAAGLAEAGMSKLLELRSEERRVGKEGRS